MPKLIYAIVGYLFISQNALLFAQSPIAEIIWGNTDVTEQALATRQAPDGSLYVAGMNASGSMGNYDITLTKLSSTGEILWSQYYGTPNNDYYADMEMDEQGNLYLVGTTENSLLDSDGIIIKVDANGNLLWQTNTPPSAVIESLSGVCLAPDGSIAVIGFKNDLNNANDCYVVKMDAMGNFLWEHTYGSDGNDVGYKIRYTPDGNYVFTADSDSFGRGTIDIYVAKIDTAGELLWEVVAGDDDYANGSKNIIVTNTGDYLISGESVVSSIAAFDLTLLKVSQAGSLLWYRQWGTPSSTEAGFGIAQLSDGSFVISGYSNAPDPNEPINGLLLHIDSLGNELGAQYFGNDEIDLLYHILPDNNGNYWLTGFQNQAGNGQYYVIHIPLPYYTGQTTNHITEKLSITAHYQQQQLLIKPSQAQTASLQLYNAQGNVVWSLPSAHYEPISYQFMLPSLPTATYFLSFTTTKQVYTMPIFVHIP